MSETVELTIVGAGALGLAIAMRLARTGREVFVVERNPKVTRGENQSTRNSGVIHAGLYYDRETRPLKAALCARGNQLLHRFCQEHDVPHLAGGKLVVATKAEERPTLEMYLARARENSVPVELIDGNAAREKEPNVSAAAALWLPTSAVFDPAAYLQKLYALASAAGAHFITGTTVTGLTPRAEGIEVAVAYPDGAADRFLTQHLVNAAGLYSDRLAHMLDPASPHAIDPMRGEAASFYHAKRSELAVGGANIYPCPHRVEMPGGTYWTVGVHLTPTLAVDAAGRVELGPEVTVGPLNFAAQGREDYGGDFRPMAEFHRQVAGFFPGLQAEDLKPHQVGIQARLAGHQDWLIARDAGAPACVHLLGCDSPALTASLAISEVVERLIGQG